MNARVALFVALLAAGCGSAQPTPAGTAAGGGAAKPAVPPLPGKADEFLIVDCLLPGEVRKMGSQFVFTTARRPIKTSARDCEIRGGEYTAYDRGDYRTALNVWRAQAEQGDTAAQTYVGEIFEKGLGVAPDYAEAARWYRRAADAGHRRAAVNLGYLYEHGLGFPRDPTQAAAWYRKGAGAGPGTVEIVFSVPPAPPTAAAQRPPRIEILEPELLMPGTRDIRVTPGGVAVAVHNGPVPDIALVGRVIADNPVKSLTVNGRAEPLDARAVFQAHVAVRERQERIRIAATDTRGLTSTLEFVVLNRAQAAQDRPADLGVPVRPGTGFGRYHALVIGNNDYRLLRPLRTAVTDARAIATLLEQQYRFKVTLLLNASRYEILSVLNTLRAELTGTDNLLVYYAGHGELDRVNQRGHWLPVDAEPGSPANWISNISVTDILNAMAVQQLLVVADSCYSGAMTRSSVIRLEPNLSPDAQADTLRTIARQRSRLLLTSGGLEPVVDSAGGPHSPFAQSFLDLLRANKGMLPAQELFRHLQVRVVTTVRDLDVRQLPEYAPIRFAGHESGDFIFVRAP